MHVCMCMRVCTCVCSCQHMHAATCVECFLTICCRVTLHVYSVPVLESAVSPQTGFSKWKTDSFSAIAKPLPWRSLAFIHLSRLQWSLLGSSQPPTLLAAFQWFVRVPCRLPLKGLHPCLLATCAAVSLTSCLSDSPGFSVPTARRPLPLPAPPW